MKSKLIKSIALLLTMVMIFASLAACTSVDELGSESSGDTTDGSDNSNSNGDDANDDDTTNSSEIVLWKDSEYQAKVIRHETADEFEKTMYTDIRSLIKSKTSKMPSAATDFVAAGAELDDGPAILIGDTDYTESKNLAKKLKDGQAKAAIVGNKYVMCWTTEESGLKLNDNTSANNLASIFRNCSIINFDSSKIIDHSIIIC